MLRLRLREGERAAPSLAPWACCHGGEGGEALEDPASGQSDTRWMCSVASGKPRPVPDGAFPTCPASPLEAISWRCLSRSTSWRSVSLMGPRLTRHPLGPRAPAARYAPPPPKHCPRQLQGSLSCRSTATDQAGPLLLRLPHGAPPTAASLSASPLPTRELLPAPEDPVRPVQGGDGSWTPRGNPWSPGVEAGQTLQPPASSLEKPGVCSTHQLRGRPAGLRQVPAAVTKARFRGSLPPCLAALS